MTKTPPKADGRQGIFEPEVTALPEAAAGARIGLFGGSFNPFHEGHRLVALQCLERLGLLASALCGRPLRVAPGEPGAPTWTDGSVVFVDADLSPRAQVEALAAQASLLAAGSLEPALVRRLAKRNGLKIPEGVFADEDTFRWVDFLDFLHTYDLAASVIRTAEEQVRAIEAVLSFYGPPAG